MSSPITVIAELEAKPEFAAECRAALGLLIAATLQEPGCLCYQLHQSLKEPPRLDDPRGVGECRAALSAHQQQPHFLTFMTNTQGWFASTNVRRYQLA